MLKRTWGSIVGLVGMVGVWVLFLMPAGSCFAQALNIPAAIYSDPPADVAPAASGQGVQFRSHGSLINAQLYRPAGGGSHPTVVLLHGLPGNEQNLDLAQAIRRAGWTVITFHYRGSWGSGGKFTLAGGVDDARALLELLHQPATATAWGVDASRIVLVGHSYGGYVAARVAIGAPGVIGVALIAPWDISFDEKTWRPMTPAARQAAGLKEFDDVDGRLVGATASSLTEEIRRSGFDLDLARLAEPLAQQRLLVITATHDSEDDQAVGLLAALRRVGAQQLTAENFDTDHGFNSRRIELEIAVVRWLEAVPGAPAPTPARAGEAANAIAGAGADSAEVVVQRQVDAYNARDVRAFVATYASDAEIYEYPAKLVMKGSAQIEEFYKNKRFNDPRLHGVIANRIVMGDVVVDHEKIVLTFPEGPGRLEAIATYEVKAGKIVRVTLMRGEKVLDSATQADN